MKGPSSTYICLPPSTPLRPTLRSNSRQARLSPFSSSSKMAADKWLAGPLNLGHEARFLERSFRRTTGRRRFGRTRPPARSHSLSLPPTLFPISLSLVPLSLSRSRSIRKSSPRAPFSSAARAEDDRGYTAYLRRKLGRASDPRVAPRARAIDDESSSGET